MKEIDKFYLEKQEPIKSCLLALRTVISNYHSDFEQRWYYWLPCFMYKKQIFCYLWIDKKTQFPYIAIGKGIQLKHPELIQGKRTFTKLLMIDPNKDIPVAKIYTIVENAMQLYS